MAVEKVTKVLVAVHESDRDQFLRELQRQGVLHITRDESAAEAVAAARDRAVGRISAAIELLSAKAGRPARAKPVLSRSEFEQAAVRLEHEQTLARFDAANRELLRIEARLQQLAGEMGRLRHWRSLRHDIASLYGLRQVAIVALRFSEAAGFEGAAAALTGLPAVLEPVSAGEDGVFALLAYATDPVEIGASVERALAGIGRETVDLRWVRGSPAEMFAELERERHELEERHSRLRQEMAELASELPRLKVAADALGREIERQSTAEHLDRTVSVRLIHGWVRERDRQKLAAVVESHMAASLVEVEPEPDEEPPVALVNPSVVRPFEMVLELFSLPSPRELDPTWLIAPFFGAFFAICLTDAGYGLVVTLAALLLLSRFGTGNKLLGIVLFGAILTIPAGALVGGWFGDLFTPERLNVPALSRVRDSLIWFDPVKEPMKFFVLSIALGYLQLIAGILFEIVDCLRVRNWGDGLLGQLPWFVLLNGLVARFVLARSLSQWAGSALLAAVLAAVAAIIVFTQRSPETMAIQWLWFGLLAGTLVTFGWKLGWLSAIFANAYWVALVAFAALLAVAVRSVVRERRFGAVTLLAGVSAVLCFAGYLAGWLVWVVPAVVGVLFFSLSPAGRGTVAKLLWGGYALYGATSYIGVVLSYIRLMALGMCTGGVAVAINVIAWMLLKVPVIGVPLAVIVFVGGHAYNIAVNVLGAFVHSLRLQYVEFFPRFYSGGGEPFRPFGERFNWVTVK